MPALSPSLRAAGTFKVMPWLAAGSPEVAVGASCSCQAGSSWAKKPPSPGTAAKAVTDKAHTSTKATATVAKRRAFTGLRGMRPPARRAAICSRVACSSSRLGTITRFMESYVCLNMQQILLF